MFIFSGEFQGHYINQAYYELGTMSPKIWLKPFSPLSGLKSPSYIPQSVRHRQSDTRRQTEFYAIVQSQCMVEPESHDLPTWIA
jgi:hypothetical protein